MKRIGRWLIFVLPLILGGLLFVFFFFSRRERERVLQFAMFGGSNWDVEIQDSYPVIDAAIEKFEKNHPGVRVHYVSGIQKEDYSEWLAEKALLDEMPDVMMVLDRDFEQLIALGLLEELDAYIERDADFDKERFYPAALEGGFLGGGRFALPYEAMPYLMFVNRSLLEENHISIPEESYTFGDLYRICRLLARDRDGDKQPDHFGIYKYDWQDAALSNGVRLFSDDGKEAYFNQENLAQAIRFVKSLRELAQGQNVTKEMFDSGNVAFMPLSLAEYRTYKSYPYKIKKYTEFSWDCISMPKGPLGQNVSMIDSLNIAISSRSDKKDLAWEFLKTLTYDEEIQSLLYEQMPVASVLQTVMEDEGAARVLSDETGENLISSALISEIMKKGSAKPKFTSYSGAILLADSEILKIYEGEGEVSNALRLIQRQVSEYLAQ